MFSKACEYGIRATIWIAARSRSGERASLKRIAEAIDSPEAFTAKILQQLTRSKILTSTKGPVGGFHIEDKKRSALRLSDVVRALDGDRLFEGCGLGLPECDASHPCPLHDQFVAMRQQIHQLLDEATLDSLVNGLGEGVSVLKR